MLVSSLLLAAVVVAQSPDEQLALFDSLGYARPIALPNQWLQGAAAPIGARARGKLGISIGAAPDGPTIMTVASGGPADRADLKSGDLLRAIDGSSVRNLAEALERLDGISIGAMVRLGLTRQGQSLAVELVADSAEHIYKESQHAPVVRQFMFEGTASVTCGVQRNVAQPNSVDLWIFMSSFTAGTFEPDDTKFFVLDGTGQQLQRISLDEIKHSIQVQVASSWHGGHYPLPPPPTVPQQYTIQRTDAGTFALMNSVSGTGGPSISTYTVVPQAHTDYAQLGYLLGLADRLSNDRKANESLLSEAKKTTARWEASYFNGRSAMISGENRQGAVRYWTGSGRTAQPPFTVVLFLRNPRTQREERMTFAFGQGAESLKAGLESTMATPPETSARSRGSAADLRNGDIMELVGAGLSNDVIVAKIKASHTSFDTSPTGLVALKKAGIAESIILAMVQAGATAP